MKRIAIFAAAAVATSSLALVAPASAVPVADADRIVLASIGAPQNPTAKIVAGATFTLAQYGAPAVAGSTVQISVTSCGQPVQAKTYVTDGTSPGVAVWFSADGTSDLSPNEVNAKIGPSFEYQVNITQPGFDTYTYEGSYSGYGVARPSCATILAGAETSSTSTDELKVVRWSTKVASPKNSRVSGRASVARISKTVSNGDETYTWTVKGKPVGKGLKLRVKSAWAGKALAVKVVAEKNGEMKSKTIKFGRVKR